MAGRSDRLPTVVLEITNDRFNTYFLWRLAVCRFVAIIPSTQDCDNYLFEMNAKPAIIADRIIRDARNTQLAMKKCNYQIGRDCGYEKTNYWGSGSNWIDHDNGRPDNG